MRYILLALAFFFAIAWAMAFIVFHVAGFLVHVFLVLALILIVVHLLRPRPAP